MCRLLAFLFYRCRFSAMHASSCSITSARVNRSPAPLPWALGNRDMTGRYAACGSAVTCSLLWPSEIVQLPFDIVVWTKNIDVTCGGIRLLSLFRLSSVCTYILFIHHSMVLWIHTYVFQNSDRRNEVLNIYGSALCHGGILHYYISIKSSSFVIPAYKILE